MSRLKFGVEVDGKLHSEFALRLPTVADNLAIFEGNPEASSFRLNVATLAKCLTRLGELEPTHFNDPDWLAEHLVDDDYDVLQAEMAELKKKRLDANSASADSGSLS
ncbi:hypothetical protein [Chitinibacter sp. S2-10]|uniref:hypothetical protein n=1 Tax=Chitinibacter sp. S2-10 TaxID=3373597 RepID=UPI003977572C